MSRFFVHPDAPDGWKTVVGARKWKEGRSAHAVAHSWHYASGFPSGFKRLFETHGKPFDSVELIAGIPEYRVALPGGETGSQTDLLVLARSESGTMAIAVEGKVKESFGPTIEAWRREASEGKKIRLAFLLRLLGLRDAKLGEIRYQLLHRTASALIEADRLNAPIAAMIVHSFDGDDAGIGDFEAFGKLLAARVAVGRLVPTRVRRGADLYLGWVREAG